MILFIVGGGLYIFHFPRLRLFQGLRLLINRKFPMPTFIQEPTSIRDSRVGTQEYFYTKKNFFQSVIANSFKVQEFVWCLFAITFVIYLLFFACLIYYNQYCTNFAALEKHMGAIYLRHQQFLKWQRVKNWTKADNITFIS